MNLFSLNFKMISGFPFSCWKICQQLLENRPWVYAKSRKFGQLTKKIQFGCRVLLHGRFLVAQWAKGITADLQFLLRHEMFSNPHYVQNFLEFRMKRAISYFDFCKENEWKQFKTFLTTLWNGIFTFVASYSIYTVPCLV